MNLLLLIRLGSEAGVQEAAAEDLEAAAAEGAGGETTTGRGGAAQTGGRDPPDPRPVQPGRAVQPLHEAGGREDDDTQQGKRQTPTTAAFNVMLLSRPTQWGERSGLQMISCLLETPQKKRAE